MLLGPWRVGEIIGATRASAMPLVVTRGATKRRLNTGSG